MAGSSAILVTPSYNSSYPVTFSYLITDGNGGYAAADVFINISNNSTESHSNRHCWTDPNYSIEMVRISSGTFMMGSSVSETDRNTDEGPQHQVTISRDFYLGKYEVTQGQWESVMGGADPWPGSNPSSSYGRSSSNPAYYISWNDINAVGGFLDKLNEASDCDISLLPTDSTRYRPDNVPRAVIDYRLKLSGSIHRGQELLPD